MNKWEGIGNLVRDPDLSYTQQSQTAKCVFTIACNRPKKNGEDQGADFIRIVTWGKRAETCDRYLSRGRKVAIVGTIRSGSYKDKDGRTVFTTDVWADEVEFLTQNLHHQDDLVSIADVTPAAEPEKQMGFDDLPDSFSAAEGEIPF